MYLKYRNASGVQTPVLNAAQIPALPIDKIPMIPFSKQNTVVLWSGSQSLSAGNVITLKVSAANIGWMDFEYMYADGTWLPVNRVYYPNGKTVDLTFGTAIGTQVWNWRARIKVLETKVTFQIVEGAYPDTKWPVDVRLRVIRGGNNSPDDAACCLNTGAAMRCRPSSSPWLREEPARRRLRTPGRTSE